MQSKPVHRFTARVIENLNEQISKATTDSERNILFARKSFALARHSQVQDARDLIRELRAINAQYQDTRLSAWIMFAEGVIEYSDTLNSPKSKDRIFRAHLVGQVVNDPSLAGTAAAWLAFFSLTEGKFAESRDYLGKAFAWTNANDLEARSRACMVFGMAFFHAADLERARYWMQLARNQAVTSGDIAMQNIVLFNSAAFQTNQISLLDCTGELDPKELQFAVMFAQSAGNLNSALGISNQSSMVPVQRAELLTAEKKWDLAISLFDEHIDASTEQGQAKWAAKHFAQRAWCKANLSDFGGCRADLQTAIYQAEQPSDPDDLAILHYRIAGSARLMGEDRLCEFHQAMAEKCLEKLSSHRQAIVEQFSDLADSIRKK